MASSRSQPRQLHQPLAELLRPSSWEDFQAYLSLDTALLARLQKGEPPLPSLVLWGPPGVGKTTFARLIGQTFGYPFVQLSAVLSGVKEVREVVEVAKKNEEPTILFVDEIHRFNKAQQDAFLPHVEEGRIIFMGATTENPSFALTQALLSRVQVVVFSSIPFEGLSAILHRAEKTLERSFAKEAKEVLLRAAGGDARRLLNLLEGVVAVVKKDEEVTAQRLQKLLPSLLKKYDRSGEDHYNLISAFIKSLRGSDADAALYYGFRILGGGEDPRFLIRRMMIFASEDVGNADPRALQVAVATSDAYERLGLPEGRIPIAQCITYLAGAPKSNRSYQAMHKAIELIEKYPHAEVPLHLRNAPTTLLKELHYGEAYQYPHDFSEGYVQEQYLPVEVGKVKLYEPSDRGYEKQMKERWEWLKGKK